MTASAAGPVSTRLLGGGYDRLYARESPDGRQADLLRTSRLTSFRASMLDFLQSQPA
jgi:hypothetical protein